ncbi:type I-C CRISPR-associated protein Cas7/Csd2 [Loigolactobacillus coryniformis]|jgi:CRISPR-associated protein Csd2|uniref:type I-C CRISPR-associated protein Cas7/Csd2 n=1 Tax=Loigolactobacillus coryniformis TaxID=1610 RepID=UPI001C5E1FE4|nr:type I-C CRISPR-associated protein Cas7/Csd2 [Loigolactobacillus coryniformis]MBW4802151.1 type I-C CRISPR-associated protein Cas7/Csd2 [Loigolactobacillus coryniformis subsp. torquens]MBW4804579.1 type I-C CRISPR-associated protein Cas7/Csd2 [Loigolactobacillus coryniformis subsp. torquens]
MTAFQNKIDFTVVFSVKNANPNGDPLNGNRPRQNFDGYGEVSDVAIKRKIRNRLQDMGQRVFVQSNDRADDGFKSLKDRADAVEELEKINKAVKGKKDPDLYAKIAAETWIDVRSFGQVFAFKDSQMSVGVRGPVSIQTAVSVNPITPETMQITKSVNSVTSTTKGSDTMGTKHFVDFGVYVFNGSINTQLAEKTGFTTEDAENIKEALRTLFENDASSARPDGSMAVIKLFWWQHPGKMGKYSSAKVHRSVTVTPKAGVTHPRSIDDYTIAVAPLEGIELSEIDGL